VAKLTKGRRKKLRKNQFASPKGGGPNPGKNQYPVHDRAHAIAAKGRAKAQLKKGKLSPSTYARIRAKANKVLKRKKR
jgi:hypothetical protein